MNGRKHENRKTFQMHTGGRVFISTVLNVDLNNIMDNTTNGNLSGGWIYGKYINKTDSDSRLKINYVDLTKHIL